MTQHTLSGHTSRLNDGKRYEPALMTRLEYQTAQTALDVVAGLESAGSLHRRSEWDAEHLRYVRTAVHQRADVHVENWVEYKQYIHGLNHYSVNGNLAVFDSSKDAAAHNDPDLRLELIHEVMATTAIDGRLRGK